jgi:glycosyltransferase involved in cell wall biosynthesis
MMYYGDNITKIMLLSIIIPAYNEEKTIEKLLDKVFAVPVKKEVVVVNDGSTDGTKKILTKITKRLKGTLPSAQLEDFKVITVSQNKGKGFAIRTAVKSVSGDIVIIQDADLELDPSEYPKLLQPFETQDADIVFGSRFQMSGTRHVFRSGRYLVNRILTLFSNLLSGLYLTDMATCYKVWKTEIIKSFDLKSDGFAIDPELTAKAAKGRYKIYEVPISYTPRTWSDGKKIGFKAGFEHLCAIVWFNLFK